MRLLLLDIAEGYESRQLEIARHACAHGRVVRLQTQDPGEKKRVTRDACERTRLRQEGVEIAIVAAVFPGVAVSLRRTGTFGSAISFGNIIVPRIFLFGAFARRARQGLRHDG
jgi:hypothetical protein